MRDTASGMSRNIAALIWLASFFFHEKIEALFLFQQLETCIAGWERLGAVSAQGGVNNYATQETKYQ